MKTTHSGVTGGLQSSDMNLARRPFACEVSIPWVGVVRFPSGRSSAVNDRQGLAATGPSPCLLVVGTSKEASRPLKPLFLLVLCSARFLTLPGMKRKRAGDPVKVQRLDGGGRDKPGTYVCGECGQRWEGAGRSTPSLHVQRKHDDRPMKLERLVKVSRSAVRGCDFPGSWSAFVSLNPHVLPLCRGRVT